MEVQRIKLEGRGIDVPRNKRRLFVEASTKAKGVTVAGHQVKPGTERIEIYEDALPSVMARTRSKEQRMAYKQASKICDNQTQAWLKANADEFDGMDPESPEYKQKLSAMCNHRPEHFLELVDPSLRTGLPPIRSLKVVTPDGSEAVDVFDFVALEASEQERFYLDPPTTSDNAQERAAESLAKTLADALGKRDETFMAALAGLLGGDSKASAGSSKKTSAKKDSE